MNRSGAPTTYKRITPNRGCGFILKRIYELTEAPGCAGAWPRKIDVYLNTRWHNRSSFASLLWSSLIKDGLIESNGGIRNYKCWSWSRGASKNRVAYRAAGRYIHGKYTVCYYLTPKGRRVLFDMMNRVNAKNKTQSKLNVVGSVAEYDAKKDGRELPQAVKVNKGCEYDPFKNMTKTDLICAYRNAAMEADQLHARLFLHENNFTCNGINYTDYYNSTCARRDALAKEIQRREKNEMHDILEKEVVDYVNPAVDYAGENQKLRAEKEDLKERLKKIMARLERLEHEIADAKAILAEITE